MFNKLSILKGIHPGFVLDRELKKRKLSKRRFALSISAYPQTIGMITKGHRDMNTALSLKIEKELGLEEGFLMTLQAYFDIKKEKEKHLDDRKPDLSLIRPSLFWDTEVDKINWDLQKKAVIIRVFERGNEEEKKVITEFYGKKTVNLYLEQAVPKPPLTLNGITPTRF